MTKTLIVGLLGLVVACGGGDLALPAEGEPVAITIVDGNEQSGRAGALLANPIVAQVTDAQNRPVEGATVVFTFSGGQGSDVVPDTVTTNADGLASAAIQLGNEVGNAEGMAMIAGTSDAELQAPFTAVTVPANASEMRQVSGDDQSGRVGTVLPQPLAIRVTDAFGNPSQGGHDHLDPDRRRQRECGHHGHRR